MPWVCLPDEDWLQAVRARLTEPGDPAWGVWALDASVPDWSQEIELLVCPPWISPERLQRTRGLPRLRHVQLLSAGYDHVLGQLPEGVALANAAGVHDTATAEHALALILAAQRDLPAYVRSQGRRRWEPTSASGLADHRVLVVGYGRIGSAIARRLAPFEVDIVGVATRPRDGDEHVPHVHGVRELPVLLPHADVVVVITPMTEATRGLVDAGFLAAMRPGALLVNVARGPIVDTDALLEACAAGRVRAALDVTDPEPLPPGHPLFATPGVLLSPHVGGATAAFRPRAAALVARQVAAYAARRPLENIVQGA